MTTKEENQIKKVLDLTEVLRETGTDAATATKLTDSQWKQAAAAVTAIRQTRFGDAAKRCGVPSDSTRNQVIALLETDKEDIFASLDRSYGVSR